jgi:5S rRNA maturation endonuclease (ribonuclease M5)
VQSPLGSERGIQDRGRLLKDNKVQGLVRHLQLQIMIVSRSSECPYCGSDHSNSCYIVYENGDYCFSCGGGTRKDATFYAYKPRIEIAAKKHFVPEYTFNIKEFSPSVLKWLYSYYFDDTMIREARIAYCAPDSKHCESIIFPVVSEDNIITEFQRRFFPKGFYSTSNLKQYVYSSPRPHYNSTVVLVEDFISAQRVGQYCNTICLFGTKLTPQIIQELLLLWTDVKIWLDPDKPGQDSAEVIVKTLATQYQKQIRRFPLKNHTQINIENIVSSKQPKELSPSQLSAYL